MKNLQLLFLLFLVILLTPSCTEKPTASLLLLNGKIATMDKNNPSVEAVAIQDNRIVLLGTTAEVKKWQGKKTKVIDLKGQFAMPGFIEGHGHFSGLGKSLMNLNFLTSKNWNEIVAMVAQKAKTTPKGEWIIGGGWHQEKWNEKLDRQVLGYPYHDDLSAVSPDHPVLLRHASGHGVFANKKAMELAGINIETPNPSGGEIVRDGSGKAIGMFEENAMSLIYDAYLAYQKTLSQEDLLSQWYQAIDLAQTECINKGITSFQDAGSSFDEIKRYAQLAKNDKLNLRLWAMLRHSYDEMKGQLNAFPIIDEGNHFFTCRALKTEVDGALGSYGAWLLAPYHDKPNFVGQNTTSIEEVTHIAQLAMKNNLQLCVHSIGDRANREVLNIFEKQFKSNPKKDYRWRIEHAQHLDPKDIPRFKKWNIIASMQGIHCTSDAPFVVSRLGEKRAKEGAYPWRSLLDAGAIIANGTDAPVEDVNPLKCFYALVTRQRADTGLKFFTEQKMTREEALYAYTLNNAFAAFEEKEKGSLEVGKLADIVVLTKDLRTCKDSEILQTKVLFTIIGGKIKQLKIDN
ncbi:MAG TPA: amidohydrolase [Phaeodactylibacter sp.]|nr:amidohydrolase [Phaeodactylibacter sp.]